jgi:LPXTG-motif cell wall-anchored protein
VTSLAAGEADSHTLIGLGIMFTALVVVWLIRRSRA